MSMASVVGALLVTGCSGGDSSSVTPQYVLTYADNQSEDYPTVQGAERFAELVSDATDGRIQILVHAGAELGDEDSAVEQVQLGGIDFARASLSILTDYSGEAYMLLMPYEYEDDDHMWTVLNGDAGQEVMNSFDGTGLVPLSWYDAGARSFYANREIHTPSDMSGLTIRVQPSDLMTDMIELLGASPSPLAYSEVYSALQTGAVDGAENNWNSFESMGHNEVARYFIEDEHMRAPELQLISQVTWDRLSESDREILRSCARESAEYERELFNEREAASREECISGGTQVITLTDEEKSLFRDAVAPLYEKYCSEYSDMMTKIQNASGQQD